MMKRLLLSLLVALIPTQGFAQATVLQGGSFTPGLPNFYSSSGGSQPIIQQAAPAGGGAQSIKEMSIVKRGAGSAPYVGGGGGFLGSTFCMYDAPIANASGGHQLCFDPNATGGFGTLTFQSFGGASSIPFKMNINGTVVEFPFTTGGVIGPGSSIVGHTAVWANTAGTLLGDGGSAPVPGGSTGQLQYNNAGAFGGFALSGDCTLAQPAITCTKVNGVTVSLGGALTTAGAVTVSGAFPVTLTATASTSITLPLTGTLATLAGTETLTNKTLTAPVINAGDLGSATTAVTQSAGDNSAKVATTAYVDSGALPSGLIAPFAGATAPSGWTLCFGQAVSRSTFATLFAVIGTTYGVGDGSTTFNLPDLRGRAAFGADAMGGTPANRLGTGATGGITGGATIGASGGEQSHVQTIAEMAAHNHTGGFQAAGAAILQTGGLTQLPQEQVTGTTGTSAAANILPPALVLSYIIKN